MTKDPSPLVNPADILGVVVISKLYSCITSVSVWQWCAGSFAALRNTFILLSGPGEISGILELTVDITS